MGYENAPQTRMLATQCAACGRSLVDAESVNTGMGPDCRKRHGYNQKTDDASRREVNKLVYRLSLWRSKAVTDGVLEVSGPEAVESLKRIRALGFIRLVGILEQRLTTVQIESDHGAWSGQEGYLVFTPFNWKIVEAFKQLGMRWDKERKAWLFTPSARTPKAVLREVLEVHFKGHLAIGPKGPFLLEKSTTTQVNLKPSVQTELPLVGS